MIPTMATSLDSITPRTLFDLSSSASASIFRQATYAWEPLGYLDSLIEMFTEGTRRIDGDVASDAFIDDGLVVVEPGARVESGASVRAPAYIGAGATVRHGAYARERTLMMPKSVLGHASEAKNTLMLEGAQAPHFAYIGDSILGERANLGAGTKLSNLGVLSVKDAKTGTRPTIVIDVNGESIDTGLPKLGAVLGADVHTGCNAVLNPGCVVGKRTIIYANVSLRRGVYGPNQIIKLRQELDSAPRF